MDESDQNPMEYSEINELDNEIKLDFQPTKRVSVPFDSIKQPQFPKKPLSAYFIFYKEYLETHQDEFKGISSFSMYSQKISEQWRNLDNTTRQKYYKLYEIEKEKYKISVKNFYNSPEYKQYQAHKNYLEQKVEKEENQEYMSSKAGVIRPEIKHFLQSVKDVNDDFDAHSIKRLASINFHTNMCLMEQLFDGTLLEELKKSDTKENLSEEVLKSKQEKLSQISDEITKQTQELEEQARKNDEELELIQLSIDKISEDIYVFPSEVRNFNENTFEVLNQLTDEQLQALKNQVLSFKC